DTVGAEIIVRGTFSEISSVCLKLPAVTVFFINRLVYIIPDKTALIFWLRISQIRILVHGSAGISHGMGVLAADKRLTVVLCQKFSDLFYGSIHLAFYIARFIVCPVAEYALVMHKPGRIRFPQELRHLKDILPSKGFVSTGPDQYGWMVFVSLIHG